VAEIVVVDRAEGLKEPAEEAGACLLWPRSGQRR
jgi:hypothetical protein